MLKRLFILSIITLGSLNAKEVDESVIIGHYSMKEIITPGAFTCDDQEHKCTSVPKFACKDCK